MTAAMVLLVAACGGGADETVVELRAAELSPNIIVVFTDDHGYADFGLQNDDGLARTPHIDQLAADGVHFTHGYVTAPQCVPSRAGLLTGTYQGRFGLETNPDGPLRPELLTLAERLREAGYRTGMAGKWHLGAEHNNRQNIPPGTDEILYTAAFQGFDEYLEGYSETFVASHRPDGRPLRGAPERIEDRRFRVDVAAEWGRNFIQRHAQRPFYLYLPLYAPHVPLEAPAADLALFAEVEDSTRRTALAMVHATDRAVGDIRAQLEQAGISGNTLIFYLGDNGAPTSPNVRNGSSNGALVGEKGMLTEGGLRVPYVLAWPGVIPPGQVFSTPVSSLDVAATALAAADMPATAAVEGVNLLSWVGAGAVAPTPRSLAWRWLSQAAILDAGWKLIVLGDGQRFLFDLRTTDTESGNLIAEFPERAEALQSSLENWSAQLQPPGLPSRGLTRMEENFYRSHGLLANP